MSLNPKTLYLSVPSFTKYGIDAKFRSPISGITSSNVRPAMNGTMLTKTSLRASCL